MRPMFSFFFFCKTSRKVEICPKKANLLSRIESFNYSTFQDVYGIRSTPPVIYTGKRGRPPKVRPNQVDPHEKERQEIAQKFSDSSPKIVIQTEKTSNSTEQPGKSTTEDTYTTFDQVCIYWK